jgi:hypothetical protein
MGWVNGEPSNRIKPINDEIPDTVQYAGIFVSVFCYMPKSVLSL